MAVAVFTRFPNFQFPFIIVGLANNLLMLINYSEFDSYP